MTTSQHSSWVRGTWGWADKNYSENWETPVRFLFLQSADRIVTTFKAMWTVSAFLSKRPAEIMDQSLEIKIKKEAQLFPECIWTLKYPLKMLLWEVNPAIDISLFPWLQLLGSSIICWAAALLCKSILNSERRTNVPLLHRWGHC